ncbi:hypothetical protein [Brevibacterium aurantiacum]|uniref:Leucine rich repeat variant n=1 Tax=Brevibacterium aurantiacum TaxID=273384 RepID=A0A2H1JFH0_BREAU|nr:Leucine rich repeat variant [Brevibacterium aurantiacum]
MCTDHQHGQRRCRCCDPEVRRATRRAAQLHERGWEGEVGEEYASGTVEVRSRLARNSPVATIDPSPTVRAARARNGLLTDDEQSALADDESRRVRAALAVNPTTTSEVLDSLSVDRDKRVREAVARHPHTDPETLYALSTTLDRRRDLSVARSISQNPATPMEALETISAHGTDGQARLARWTLRERGG